MLTVTGKMVKTTEWDRPFWALQWEVPLFASATSSEMEVLDRACRRVVSTEVQLQRHPRLGLSKKPKEHVGSQLVLAIGCTKPFSLQVVQVRVDAFVGKQSTLLEA